jgi:hypothetical protein
MRLETTGGWKPDAPFVGTLGVPAVDKDVYYVCQ